MTKRKSECFLLAAETGTDGKNLCEKRRGGVESGVTKLGGDYRRWWNRWRRKSDFCQELVSSQEE